MTLEEILLRLGVAAAIGAAIGIDREMRHKSAGFRTIAIVCVGAALGTLTIAMTLGPGSAVAPVIQGVLTGIGFLGAGVIVHHSREQGVEGLTTAAAIWASAAIGAACGLALWLPVVVAAVLVIGLLIVGGWIERRVRR